MPLMRGRAPIRRTLEYLQGGKLVLKDNVKIFSVNYNTYGDHHHGARCGIFCYFIRNIEKYNFSISLQRFCLLEHTPSAIQKSSSSGGYLQEYDALPVCALLL